MGRLYVIGAPLRADDLTLRARRILGRVTLAAAEEVGLAQRLLDCDGLAVPLVPVADTGAVLAAIKAGDVALLLDGQRPAPSFLAGELIHAVWERGFSVVSVPGPSLAVTALVLSGLPADSFVCLGYLPERPDERRGLLTAVAGERRTLLALESPACLAETLAELYGAWGNRPTVVVAAWDQGLGVVWRGRLDEASGQVRAQPEWQGCALVIGGAQQPERCWEKARLRAEVQACLAQGLSAGQIGRQLSAGSGWPRREIYRLATRMAKDIVGQGGYPKDASCPTPQEHDRQRFNGPSG